MKLLSTLLLLLLSVNIYAQDVVAIKQGEVAKFSGNLIKTERLVQYFKDSKKLPLMEMKVDLYKTRLKQTERELSKANFKSYIGTVGGFVLGVVITGIAAKAALESTR
jgi:hypothetical protein